MSKSRDMAEKQRWRKGRKEKKMTEGRKQVEKRQKRVKRRKEVEIKLQELKGKRKSRVKNVVSLLNFSWVFQAL